MPIATYRFQFHRGFTLPQATELVPYLRDLGISHVYASPLLMAQPGSMHGYDVCDFQRLNPELGTEAEFEHFVATLRQHGLGLVLDIVPNHAGIGGPQNRWWWDVLQHGPESRFASYFDIDWDAPDPRLRGKVLVPVLGDRYQRVLEKGELKLELHDGEVRLRYYDHQFPLAPGTVTAAEIESITARPAALDALIQKQHYRLAYWRRGDSELNYRRFFTITSLAGLRAEDEQVFRDTHSLIRKWYDRGLLDGLRVDHPDGLRDPEQYLQRLRRLAPKAWIVVEKILEPGEQLPTSWPVAGTTGYDFLNRVSGLFIDPAAEKPLTRFYVEFTGQPAECSAVVRDKKRFMLQDSLAAEVDRLAALLVQVCARHWQYRDFTVSELRPAVVELIAGFPVYRTYVRAAEGVIDEADAACLTTALARREQPEIDASLFDLLGDLLLLRLRGEAETEFVMRFQQLTGPAMAKGVEDTTFYCYNRFVALNEVGGDPGQFGFSVKAFHQSCLEAQAHWPDTMLATSTHDTKRSEDVRARLSLLSEIPKEWTDTARRWSAWNERHRQHGWPDRNAEYLFYQTLVGAWPLSVERALAYMEKASCEAKQHTHWTRRNPDYDEGLRIFIERVLGEAEFTAELERFVVPLLDAGYINSLAQVLVKLTAPGVPDSYQGTELWDWCLVDPDNCRPVDYALRRGLLDEIKHTTAETAWQRRSEGLAKLWLIHRALALRHRGPQLFGAASSYAPLPVSGAKSDHAVAFARGGSVATVVPRLVLGLLRDAARLPESRERTRSSRPREDEDDAGDMPTAFLLGGASVDAWVELPPVRWQNELTGEVLEGGPVQLNELLGRFPVALLSRKENV